MIVYGKQTFFINQSFTIIRGYKKIIIASSGSDDALVIEYPIPATVNANKFYGEFVEHVYDEVVNGTEFIDLDRIYVKVLKKK